MNNELFDSIATRPWNSRYYHTPDWFKMVPALMTVEELRMLAWVVQQVSWAGAVIDLGPFMGGSTVALAYGNDCSATKKKIYSYGLFESDENMKEVLLYSRGYPRFEGRSILKVYQENTDYYAKYITTSVGDVRDVKWVKSEIAVLFVDMAKSATTHDHLLLEFYPSLQPGSIVVQQDYLHYSAPWLHFAMHRLSGCLKFLAYTEENSAIFGVERTPTEEELTAALSKNMSVSAVETAIKWSRSKFRFTRQLEMIDAGLEAFLNSPHGQNEWDFKHPIPYT